MTEMRLKLTFKKIKSISKISYRTEVYNLKCRPYPNFFSNFILVHNCDTTPVIINKRYCKIEKIKGKGFIKIKNPLSSERLFKIIKRLNEKKGPFHSVSLTGGEPLLQKDFLKELLPLIRRMGLKIYLDTNGIMSEALSELIDNIDIIAMDFKLPSSTEERNFWTEHKRFLEIASKKDIFVKAVICRSTEFSDIKRAVRLLASFDKNIPFILQPNSFEIDKDLIKKLEEFQRFSLGYLSFVRIIPQLHRFLKVK